MLTTSIFSFSHNFFFPIKDKNHYLTLYYKIPSFNIPGKESIENCVGKGVNPCYQHFLHISHFLPFPTQMSIFESWLFFLLQMYWVWTTLKFCWLVELKKFIFLSTNAFYLIQSSVLLLGKELNPFYQRVTHLQLMFFFWRRNESNWRYPGRFQCQSALW